jgi:hypothetical protein
MRIGETPEISMEAANIFPVFSQLHADDAVPTTSPLTFAPPPRKARANEAGLFLVTPENAAQCKEPNEDQEISGETLNDTETAIRALAFLIDFVNSVGTDELRRCADQIRSFREPQ